MSILVKAVKHGYYGDKRRSPGETFSVEKREHMGRWMVEIGVDVNASSVSAEPVEVKAAPKKVERTKQVVSKAVSRSATTSGLV